MVSRLLWSIQQHQIGIWVLKYQWNTNKNLHVTESKVYKPVPIIEHKKIWEIVHEYYNISSVSNCSQTHRKHNKTANFKVFHICIILKRRGKARIIHYIFAFFILVRLLSNNKQDCKSANTQFLFSLSNKVASIS